jgi:hypothetical protein
VFPVETLMVMSCTVHHAEPGAVDEYGDRPVATVTTSDERCWMAQSVRGEDELVETERWLMYLPADVVVDANDAVVVGADTYYVLGKPWVAIDVITGVPHHIEATVERRV